MRFIAFLVLVAAMALSLSAQGQQDFSKVEIKVNDLAPSLYTLE
jgi:hypothetical protein